MHLNVAGLPEKAVEYIQHNSEFVQGASIGCKNSDGIVNIRSQLYKTEYTEDNHHIFLFKYLLKDGEECFEEQQVIKNNTLFVQLRTHKGDIIKWEDTDINKITN